MKYKLLVAVVCLHLVLVTIRSFNNIVPGKSFITNSAVYSILNTYTQYTVMQADYAFFSPNVGYSPFVRVTVTEGRDSTDFALDKPGGEIGLRLFTSFTAFNNTPQARELMSRSWAAYALQYHPKADVITVSMFVKIPPSIQQYNLQTVAKDSLLFQAKYRVNDE